MIPTEIWKKILSRTPIQKRTECKLSFPVGRWHFRIFRWRMDYLKKRLKKKFVLGNRSCHKVMEKDKGCKITKPDKIGEEKIYLLEK